MPDITWHQWSIWGQDSWKATRKLTLNLGLRADHMGQWYDTDRWSAGLGPSAYDNGASPARQHRSQWHQIDSSIPNSGWKSHLFFYNPRLGAAYDVFGTGRTVVRAGFGTYRYQVSANDASAAMNGPLGSFDFNTFSTGTEWLLWLWIQGGAVCTALTGPGNSNCAKTEQIASRRA